MPSPLAAVKIANKQANGDMLQYFIDHPDKLREKKERDAKKHASFKLQGELKFKGLDIAVENKKGSKRSWYDEHGKEKGSTFMHHDYGYIRLTEGTDGDHVDVYVGPLEDAESVFIVDQMKKPPGEIKKDGIEWKQFDEQKVMLGFKSEADAKAAYLRQYNDPRFFGSIKTMKFDEFKTKVLDKANHGKKIAMHIAPKVAALPASMLSGLQHAGVGAGIGAVAGGIGGAMHADAGHRLQGAGRGALAGSALGAAGGAGISAIKQHGVQQLATLGGAAQEAEQAALKAHGNARAIESAGWGAGVAPKANPHALTMSAPGSPASMAASEVGTVVRPGGRAGRVAQAPSGPSTAAVEAHVQKPQAYGYHPTESRGPGVYQRNGQGFRKGPHEMVEGFVPPSPAQNPVVGNHALAQQQAAAAGARASGLDTAHRTLSAQHQVMNQSINRAGLAGAAAGTGLMGYMAVPQHLGGVGGQPKQAASLQVPMHHAYAYMTTPNASSLADPELHAAIDQTQVAKSMRMADRLQGGLLGAGIGSQLGMIPGSLMEHPGVLVGGAAAGGVLGALGGGHLMRRWGSSRLHRDASALRDLESSAATPPEKQASEDRKGRISDRLDDLGIGVLAAPYAANYLGHGLQRAGDAMIPHHLGLGSGLAVAGNALERAGHSMHHSDLRELAGLGLVAPGIVHRIADGIDKIAPKKKVEAPVEQPQLKVAEDVGRMLAKTAIDVGGIAGAVGRAAWRNKGTIAGATAVAGVGAGLLGAKKGIDAATRMATDHREPGRYAGVPPGMRPPEPVMPV